MHHQHQHLLFLRFAPENRLFNILFLGVRPLPALSSAAAPSGDELRRSHEAPVQMPRAEH